MFQTNYGNIILLKMQMKYHGILSQNNSNFDQEKTGEKKQTNNQVNITYSFGTSGVLLTLGWTTSPIAKIPPPLLPSKQCEKIFLTFLDEASCERMDVFACPKPTIPSTASEDEPNSPACLAEHLSQM